MWATGRRIVPPIVLLLAGTTLLVAGAVYHTVEVSFEEEFTPPAPQIPAPPPFLNRGPGRGGPRGNRPPFLAPPPPPPPKPITVIRTIDEPEHAIILEATRGGIRLADGKIMRTYSGAPPSGCPT